MTAAAVLASQPPCTACRGGGDINGLQCRECGGSGRARLQSRPRWSLRRASLRVALAAATPAGTLARWSRSVPGIGGAAAVTYGAAVLVHSIWHEVPVAAVAALVGGAFALLLDRGI